MTRRNSLDPALYGDQPIDRCENPDCPDLRGGDPPIFDEAGQEILIPNWSFAEDDQPEGFLGPAGVGWDPLRDGPIVLDEEATRKLDEIMASPSGKLPEPPPSLEAFGLKDFSEAY